MKPSLVIFGLGNPGAAYAETRHNVGFRALDAIAKEFGVVGSTGSPQGEWKERKKFLSQAHEARVVTVPVLLLKPMTFVNRSGEAVRKVVDFYKLHPSDQILILCDDVDLALGEVRFRAKGGPGTHNGLRSIVEVIGEEFPRMRIGLGVGPKGEALSSWVLSVPSAKERKVLEGAMAKIPEMVKNFVLGD